MRRGGSHPRKGDRRLRCAACHFFRTVVARRCACMSDATESVVEAVAPKAPEAPQTDAAIETHTATPSAQAAATQGRRTEGAMVSTVLEPTTHRLIELTNGTIVARRCDASPEMALVWEYAERQRRKVQRVGVASRELALNAQELIEACESTSMPLTAPSAPTVSVDVVPRSPTLPFGDARWQRKPINDRTIRQKISNNYGIEFVNDVADAKGNLYVVGEKDQGTLCGAFPHARIRPKAGSYRNREVYACNGAIDVVFSVRIFDRRVEDRLDPARYSVTERDVLRDLQCVDETGEGDGFYESALIFRFELQFDDHSNGDPNAEARYVCVDPTDHGRYAFNTPPPHNKLFVPFEDVPYARGNYEVLMVDGQASVQLSFGTNVMSKNLVARKAGRLFCAAAFCLNPYLNSCANFVATSVPFIIKKDLHNDVRKGARWVLVHEGRPVAADEALVTRLAPPRRGSVAKTPSPALSSCDEGC